ncbi:MAG: FAD-dependent oxidoreductase [Alphaproteobacteria bacterium]
MSLEIAIVGSGPGGFYAAEALLRRVEDCRVDILERLPTPYGLIRGGVAPDHQSTKRVSRAFERTALDPRVRYYGNVEVGRDVTIDELRAAYDAVVLAVGAPLDNRLGIPGEDKTGVIGSAAFVGWYNAHPDFKDLAPDLDTRAVAVIGNGNVAIDVARVLVKTPAEMAASDLPDYAAQAIHRSPLRDVYMIGRRGAVEAKFTNVELREMGQLEASAPVVDPEQLPDSVVGDYSDRDRRLREKNLATLREFASMDPAAKPRRVHFLFYAKPVEVLGGARVEGLRLERTRVDGGRATGTGEYFELACGLVIPAIGYHSQPLEGAPFDESRGIVANTDGRVEKGLYAAGWIKRGPTGVIGTNKPDGATAAEQICAEISPADKPGHSALERLLGERGVRWVTFADWQRIEQAETENASPGAPRRKFVTIAEMLSSLEEVPYAAVSP